MVDINLCKRPDRDDKTSDFGIAGKVAVVTGGGGILCGDMAKALASHGARVAVLDINEAAAQKVAAECPGEAMGFKANVLEKADLERCAKEVLAKFGRVDILVNGAGGARPDAVTSDTTNFFDLPEAGIQWVLNLNLMGTILCSQVFGRIMAEQDSGVIVNISSMSAFRPLTRTVAYSAAKAAVSNFTQWLAVYMTQNHSKNVRVNAIAPGFFFTEQNRFLVSTPEGELTPRGARIIDHTPMGVFGSPDDLLGALIWLCSPAASFVNGVILPVDGGFAAYCGV